MNKVKYPENIKLKQKLETGDVQRIADATGYARNTLYAVFDGKRKLKPIVKEAYDLLLAKKRETAESLQNLRN